MFKTSALQSLPKLARYVKSRKPAHKVTGIKEIFQYSFYWLAARRLRKRLEDARCAVVTNMLYFINIMESQKNGYQLLSTEAGTCEHE